MFRSHASILSCLLVLLNISTLAVPTRAANNWPQWRGPQGDGHTDETQLPIQWSQTDVEWRAVLNGEGHSSPVIWGEKIFLTSALDNGRQRIVMCLNRNDGTLLWEQIASTVRPEQSHKMNLFASSTCATDGRHVIAFFGRGGLHCYDVNGSHVWSRDLGQFEGTWGTAASPIILGDMVIQNCDAEQGASYLLAVDKQTGKDRWRARRPETPRGGWSTPLFITTALRPELILNGEFGVQAYDPATGEELWFCKSFNGRGTPTPVFGHGLLYLLNGKSGDVYSVRPGGSGDVTRTRMAWHTPRSGRDLPSPILVNDFLFAVNKDGVAATYHAKQGNELWKGRLGGNFAASPIAANRLIYLPSEADETLVIRPGTKLEIVARNSVGAEDDEIFRASLAPSDGQIFCRSSKALYCIGKRTTP